MFFQNFIHETRVYDSFKKFNHKFILGDTATELTRMAKVLVDSLPLLRRMMILDAHLVNCMKCESGTRGRSFMFLQSTLLSSL